MVFFFKTATFWSYVQIGQKLVEPVRFPIYTVEPAVSGLCLFFLEFLVFLKNWTALRFDDQSRLTIKPVGSANPVQFLKPWYFSHFKVLGVLWSFLYILEASRVFWSYLGFQGYFGHFGHFRCILVIF